MQTFGKIRLYAQTLGLNVKYPYLGKQGQDLYAAYHKAKAEKDYAKADAIRKEIADLGFWMV